MKVLHVLDHSVPLFSGYSFRSQSILRGQETLGLTPVVLTSPKHGSERDEVEEIEGIRYYRTKVLKERFVSGLPFVKEARLISRLAGRIREIVDTEKVDLIHSHSPSLNGLASLWVTSRLAIPFLYEARAFWEDAAVDHGTFQERSIRYRLSRALETFLFKKADKVVTICEGMRQDLVSRGVPPARIQVVPNGVDVDWFQPRARASNLVEKFALNGKPVFGFIGSFYRYEGLQFLLEVIPELIRKIPRAKLILVGGGNEEPLLRHKAELYGDSVIFAGQVPHERIRDFYSIIDIFVCPRQRIRLTELVTPLKPLEAMAMAKPVLGSDVGGLKELIQHDVTGLLFRADSKDAFMDQAIRAGGNPVLCKRLGEAARHYVAKERTWQALVARYVSLYEELHGNAGRTGHSR